MKYLLLVVLFLKSFTLISQNVDSIIYSLFIETNCDNQKLNDFNYKLFSLKNDSIILYPDSKGNCNIPIYDNYLRVVCLDGFEFSSSMVRIEKPFQSDTIIIPPIYKTINNSNLKSPVSRYFQCGLVCNGHRSSFRKDGSLWQDGEFKNGKIKILKEYSKDGTLSIIKHRFAGFNISLYDKKGYHLYNLRSFIFFYKTQSYDTNNRINHNKIGFAKFHTGEMKKAIKCSTK